MIVRQAKLVNPSPMIAASREAANHPGPIRCSASTTASRWRAMVNTSNASAVRAMAMRADRVTDRGTFTTRSLR